MAGGRQSTAERQAAWDAAQLEEEKRGVALQEQFDQEAYDFAAGIDPEEERGPYWGRQDASEDVRALAKKHGLDFGDELDLNEEQLAQLVHTERYDDPNFSPEAYEADVRAFAKQHGLDFDGALDLYERPANDEQLAQLREVGIDEDFTYGEADKALAGRPADMDAPEIEMQQLGGDIADIEASGRYIGLEGGPELGDMPVSVQALRAQCETRTCRQSGSKATPRLSRS